MPAEWLEGVPWKENDCFFFWYSGAAAKKRRVEARNIIFSEQYSRAVYASRAARVEYSKL
jgi:hypothetical protein